MLGGQSDGQQTTDDRTDDGKMMKVEWTDNGWEDDSHVVLGQMDEY